MKPIGTPPPRSRENEKALRKIYADRCKKIGSPLPPVEFNVAECFVCGEPYVYGKERFAFGNGHLYCRDCLEKALDIKDDNEARDFLGLKRIAP